MVSDDNNVIALARVFPRAVAGVPLVYHFDVTTGMFSFDTPDPAITAPTLIGVPVAIHYPNGYRVDVSLGPAGDDTGAMRPDFATCDRPTDPILDLHAGIAGTVPTGSSEE